jgi:hypothetical protein
MSNIIVTWVPESEQKKNGMRERGKQPDNPSADKSEKKVEFSPNVVEIIYLHTQEAETNSIKINVRKPQLGTLQFNYQKWK